jgi:hypothetical protein
MNEILQATDIEAQRRENACLGTAVNLEIDAVRLVLTGHEGVARQYFQAIRKLTVAAIEDGETWIYTDTYFAKCEALRLRTVAGWALGIEDSRDCVNVLQAWRVLSEAATTSSDLGERNALTIYALIAAHCGNFELAAACVKNVICRRPTPWCELLSLLKDLNSPNQYSRWSDFLATRIISQSADELIDRSFNEGEACMIAGVVSALKGERVNPFRVIEMLRGVAPT